MPKNDVPTKSASHLSMKAIATTYGIDIKQLKAAKALGGDGFNSNNSVNWDVLKPWMAEHSEEIESFLNDELAEIIKAGKVKDNKLKDLEIAKWEKRLIERDSVNAMGKSIGAAQSSLLNTKLIKELLPKMKGKELAEMVVLTNQCIKEIIDVIQNQKVDKWSKD